MTPPNTQPGTATRSRSDKRGDARRRRIFRSLHDCILAKGYVRTTLADIAGAAGMTPSHLLYYFKGKEDILEQYFQTVAERFVERLQDLAELPLEPQIQALADFWFRGETSNRQEIGFMLECFGAAVHDEVLRVTKTAFDRHCKGHLNRLFQLAPQSTSSTTKDAAELAYASMIGLRSAVYFDDELGLEDAHALFVRTIRQMCGLEAS